MRPHWLPRLRNTSPLMRYSETLVFLHHTIHNGILVYYSVIYITKSYLKKGKLMFNKNPLTTTLAKIAKLKEELSHGVHVNEAVVEDKTEAITALESEITTINAETAQAKIILEKLNF